MIRLLVEKSRISRARLLLIAVVGVIGWSACAPESPKDLPPSGLPDRVVDWEDRGRGWVGDDPSLKFPDGVTFEIKSRIAEIRDGKKIHRSTLGSPADERLTWVADATGSGNIWRPEATRSVAGTAVPGRRWQPSATSWT